MRHLLLLLAAAGLVSPVFSQATAPREWTNRSGQTMTARFVKLEGGLVHVDKGDGRAYAVPLAQLSDEDQAWVRGFVSADPASAPAGPQAARPAAVLGEDRVGREFARDLVVLRGRDVRREDAARIAGTRYYGLYYTAKWCPPCQKFTPELKEAYARIRRDHPDFEVIQVSSDRSEDELEAYLEQHQVPWPAVRWGEQRGMRQLGSWEEDGIPNLVIVDRGGNVIARSYVGGDYVGPRAALKQFEDFLARGP